MEFTLTAEDVAAAQKRLDAGKAGACIRAGRLDLIEAMIGSELTLQQVQAELSRQPASARPAASGFESFAGEAYARMRAPAPAPAAPGHTAAGGPSPVGGGRLPAWPAGRPQPA